MNHDQLAAAIEVVRPGATWRLWGDDYATLEWRDQTQAKPTRAEIEAAALPLPVPPFVTQVQARKALRARGLIEEVKAAVAAASPDVQDTWEYALQINRGDALLKSIAAQIGLADAEVDDLFRFAATL
jgi:hypothetical protein